MGNTTHGLLNGLCNSSNHPMDIKYTQIIETGETVIYDFYIDCFIFVNKRYSIYRNKIKCGSFKNNFYDEDEIELKSIYEIRITNK